MLLFAALIFALGLFLAKKSEKLSKYAPLGVALALALALEVCVFNFESIRSLTYEEIYTPVTHSVNVSEQGGEYVVSSPNDYLEFANVGERLGNILLKTDAEFEKVRFFASDEGSASRYAAGDAYVSGAAPETAYIRLNLTGKCDTVRVYFPDLSDGERVTVSEFEANAARPIFFSLTRFLITLCAFIFAYYVLVSRRLREMRCDFKDPAIKLLSAALAILLAVVFLSISLLNPTFVSPPWAHHGQYADLAESFTQGKLYIEQGGEDVLASLDNPYDTTARKAAFKEAGKLEAWDMAYYNGRLYVYFGVLPVIVFYLPYHIITGGEFPNFLGVVFFAWLLIAAVFLLYAKAIKLCFKDTPFILYLMLTCGTLLSGGVIYLLKRPDFYSIPIMGAAAFTVMGLYFWLCAKEKNLLSKKYLFLGSLFMASVLALRPNLILFSCAAFVMFWTSVFEDRELLSLDSKLSSEKNRALKNTLIFCAPYIVIAALVMIYNALRFSSPFDFGASYNLTTSDMNVRALSIDRWNEGIFEYLFRPPYLSGVFPFLSGGAVSSTYIGVKSWESMYGGIFMTCPLLLAYFGIFKTKKSRLYPMSVFMACCALVVCLLDIQLGGILPRYCSDFSIFFIIGAVFIILELSKSHQSLVHNFAAFSLIGIICYAALLVVSSGSSTISSTNPEAFARFYALFPQ